MREFDLLNHIYSANVDLESRVLIGPGDDMGLIQMDGRRLLAAVDQLVDGRHVVVAKTPLEFVGRKAITRSLSDIAAMAGSPLATLAAVTLPPDFSEDRVKLLFDAMRSTAQRYRCPLIGGDIAFHSNPAHPLVCSITVLAEPHAIGPITRSGAQPSDSIYVTGRLGGSLQPDGLGRHLTFEPRIDVAQHLADQIGNRLHAMIDISDGLGRELSHIASMSKVNIQIDAEQIPCNPGCNWKQGLGDGEDYELCFTAAGHVPAQIDDCKITRVGQVLARQTNQPAVVAIDEGKMVAVHDLGWEHQSSGRKRHE